MHISLLTLLATSNLVLARTLPETSFHSSRNAAPGSSLQANTCAVGSSSCENTAASDVQARDSSQVTAKAVAMSKSESRATSGKPVFFHYLIGGITDAHCEKDIIDAVALGADAFALNLAVTLDQPWAASTIDSLFKYAQVHNFKLFFSFDMTGLSSASQLISILQTYITNPAYYIHKASSKPLVSTFNGGTDTFGQSSVNEGWKTQFQDPMASSGHPIYFVPSFQDTSASSDYFTNRFPTLDGCLNWNSWVNSDQFTASAPTDDDTTYLTAAHNSGKTFIMGLSPLQFKHIDQSQNWYRRGEANLEVRFGQVLSLQPDMLEIQTWNDAGESHYMGNSWPEPLGSDTSPISLYSKDYDHTGYWQILQSFIKVWKAGDTDTTNMVPTNGKAAQGTFWHHTLLKNGDCSGDILGLGKPTGWQGVEDIVTAVVLVAKGSQGLKAQISVGGRLLGTQDLHDGYNTMVVKGIPTGTVRMSVLDGSGATVVKGQGPLDVVGQSNLCNYNFQVVGLS